jgi:hypothetical protein
MIGVIRLVRGSQEVSLLPVAGRPLLERQLEWFYDFGADEIVVEVAASEAGAEVSAWLKSSPLGLRVRALQVKQPMTRQQLAERAELSSETRMVWTRGDELARLDITRYFGETESGLRVSVASKNAQGRGASVCIARPQQTIERRVDGQGWGARIAGPHDAIELSAQVLASADQYGLSVPGRQLSPGVWAARGARVEPGATCKAPTYLDAGAWVQRGAVLVPALCCANA